MLMLKNKSVYQILIFKSRSYNYVHVLETVHMAFVDEVILVSLILVFV